MNKLFRVFFIHGTFTDLLPEEYDDLVNKLDKGIGGNFVSYAPVNQEGQLFRNILLNINHITHIIEVKTGGDTGVVRPQPPSIIRKEQQIAEEQKTRDLETTLKTIQEEAKDD